MATADSDDVDLSITYVIRPIPDADPGNRVIPHCTIHAQRGDYTSGAFLWASSEMEAERVVAALLRYDDHVANTLIPQADRLLGQEIGRAEARHG
jgi:hypothetical protein